MCSFAYKFVPDIEISKEIVHSVFVKLWDKRETLDVSDNLKPYLFRSVHNYSLNYIRDNKKFKQDVDWNRVENENLSEQDPLEQQQLSEKINSAINLLPERCKQVFLLSKFDNLKYKEIAEKLNISIKTVEAQMSKALSVLRKELKDLIKLIIFIISLKL